MKCKYCNNKAKRLHARHDNGELENLCEIHYFEWEPTQAKINGTIKECVICKTKIDNPIEHHTNYFPEQKMLLCRSCHSKEHKGKKHPESDQFYGKVVKWLKPLI